MGQSYVCFHRLSILKYDEIMELKFINHKERDKDIDCCIIKNIVASYTNIYVQQQRAYKKLLYNIINKVVSINKFNENNMNYWNKTKTLLCVSYLGLTIFDGSAQNGKWHRLDGVAQKSEYHISYFSDTEKDLRPQVDSLLSLVDNTFSLYDSSSFVYALNRTKELAIPNKHFEKLFKQSIMVSEKSNGAFDITVGPLMRYWGFYKMKLAVPDSSSVDSIMQYIGYKKLKLENGILYKESANIQLDFNAIAQGYSTDLIADLLESKKVKNYLIDIGGELRCSGKSPSGELWKIGINKPIEDSTHTINEIQQVINVSNCAVATSGNYRKFMYNNKRKLGHIFDARTGYPSQKEIVSITIIAKDCATADAYATACMALGLKNSIALIEKLKMAAYIIYIDKNNKTQEFYTKRFYQYLNKK